jgi:hypothetical protein
MCRKRICTCSEGRPFFYHDKSSVSSLKRSDMCNSFLNSAARLLEVSAADVVRWPLVLAMSGLAPATNEMRILSTVPPESSTFAKVRPSGTCGSLFCFLRRRSFLVQLHNLQVLRSRISQFQHFGSMTPFFFSGFLATEGNSSNKRFGGLWLDPLMRVSESNSLRESITYFGGSVELQTWQVYPTWVRQRASKGYGQMGRTA